MNMYLSPYLSIFLSYSSSSSAVSVSATTGTDARTPSSSAYVLYTSSSLESPFARRLSAPFVDSVGSGNRFLRCAKRCGAKNKISTFSLPLYSSFGLSLFLPRSRPSSSPSTFLSSSVCRSPSLLIVSPSAFRSEHFALRFLARSEGPPSKKGKRGLPGARYAQNRSWAMIDSTIHRVVTGERSIVESRA